MRFLLLLCFPAVLFAQNSEIILTQNLVIQNSGVVKTGRYVLQASAENFAKPTAPASIEGVITIEGDGITVDFQGAELRSAADAARPDLFSGLAIRVKGRNITLKNAIVRGFKVALLAEGAQNLTLENCDFSYNYRPRLLSTPAKENESDWLSYHHNDKDEWLRYGAGIYLKNCPRATVRGCRITGNSRATLSSWLLHQTTDRR